MNFLKKLKRKGILQNTKGILSTEEEVKSFRQSLEEKTAVTFKEFAKAKFTTQQQSRFIFLD